MKQSDLKYFPISKKAQTLSLESLEFKKIKEAYAQQVAPVSEGELFDIEKQALCLQKVTMFFEGGKSRTRYILHLLEPTWMGESENTPSPHLLLAFIMAYDLGGKMKITCCEMLDESICLCNQYEDNIHLN
jgi:hypothetical protein